jgi:hypothetical protein
MIDFFGYGSLVNLQTHQYSNPRPTKIKGWKRKWVSSNIHDIAFLSVTPCDFNNFTRNESKYKRYWLESIRLERELDIYVII